MFKFWVQFSKNKKKNEKNRVKNKIKTKREQTNAKP
jgi:hypothetical protein